MSHFSVMVICDTSEEVDALLAPFKENDGDCPRQYLEFTDIEEEYREKYEKGSAEYVRAKDDRLLLPWDDEFRVPGAIGIGTNTHEVPDDLPRVEIPTKFCTPLSTITCPIGAARKKTTNSGNTVTGRTRTRSGTGSK